MRNAHKAVSCLVKRSEPSALQAAVSVLVAAEQLDDARLYAQKYVQECLLRCDWLAAEEMIKLQPSFNVSVLVFSTDCLVSLIPFNIVDQSL
jgi:hypothetical protein